MTLLRLLQKQLFFFAKEISACPALPFLSLQNFIELLNLKYLKIGVVFHSFQDCQTYLFEYKACILLFFCHKFLRILNRSKYYLFTIMNYRTNFKPKIFENHYFKEVEASKKTFFCSAPTFWSTFVLLAPSGYDR